MSAVAQEDCHHFVLLQHGIWGTAADFTALVRRVFEEEERRYDGTHAAAAAPPPEPTATTNRDGGCLFARRRLTCFVPGSSRLVGTHRSTCSCARRTLAEFLPVFGAWLRAAAADGSCPACVSVVGHSFGGIIVREFLYLLLAAAGGPEFEDGVFAEVRRVRAKLVELNVTFANFITIATPHCGVSQCLSPTVYWGTRMLAAVCAPSLRELLLTDAAAVLSTRLIDDPHLAALRLFRRRTLFANTQKDVLVGFATSALLCDAAGGADAPPRASAFAAGDGAFAATTLLPPLRGERGGVAPTHTLRDLRCEGAGAGEAPQTHE
ncbi:uncharacterized protein Tco025E_09102, partial [Trypanosoma conorhini]